MIQRHCRILLGILTITALVYLRGVFTHDFVSLDDLLLIVQNETVHGLSPTLLWRAFTSYDPELYVPLTLFTYQVEFSITGLHPVLYHIDNLLLHLGSVVLVYACVKRISASESLGLLCAMLFALHPLNVEAVSWAAARKDVLSGFFALLSFWSFLRFRQEGDRKWYHTSIATFALALLAKVSVILLPVAWMLLEGRENTQKRWKDYAPFFGLMLLFGAIALFGKTTQIEVMRPGDQLLLSLKALTVTVSRFLLPIGLNPYYPQRTPIGINGEFLTVAAAVTLMGVLAWTQRRRLPVAAWGMAFFALMMTPSFMNFWKKGTLYVTTDRYGYLGIIGLSVALGSVLLRASERLPKRIAQSTGVGLALVLASLSFVQSATWNSSIALYERALALDPNFAPVLNNLGAAFYAAGDEERSLALQRKALESDPSLTSASINIALHLRKQGDRAGALKMLRTGIAQIPPHRPALEEEVTAWSLLGTLLDEQGNIDDALAAFAKGAEHAPKSPDAHYNYGVMLQKYGRREDARRELLAYLDLRPHDIEGRYRLAAMEAELGLLSEAQKNLAIVVSRNPEYEKSAEHLRRIQSLLKK
ncbi:tetratricopeptide repeat protein [Candidatus Peribacteria bacterium]|nr:tetratricopeptide repeat protein [Candidatus Peribacteria bacterium]